MAKPQVMIYTVVDLDTFASAMSETYDISFLHAEKLEDMRAMIEMCKQMDPRFSEKTEEVIGFVIRKKKDAPHFHNGVQVEQAIRTRRIVRKKKKVVTPARVVEIPMEAKQ